MSYSINKYNGTFLANIADGSLDSTTDLLLVGKNYSGYGTFQNDNFLYLLENFSNIIPPQKPITGQLWFDSASNKLKFYDNNLTWRVSSGADISTAAPSNLTEGDFWFDPVNKQLYVYSLTGSSAGTPGFVLVGPPQSTNQGSGLSIINVLDTNGINHDIIEAVVEGVTLFTVSSGATFTLSNINPIAGFEKIHPGVTLVNTNDLGQTLGAERFWGTATNALKLNNVDASQFVQHSGIYASFASSGFTVGDTATVQQSISGNNLKIKNLLGGNINISAMVNSVEVDSISIQPAKLVPATDSIYDIGSTSLKFNNIYSNSFHGIADNANLLQVDNGLYFNATVLVPVTTDKTSVVSRDSLGNLYGNTLYGTATAALYADLAEKYLADQDYEVGTVVMVGGEKEVTACILGSRAIGVVSANPAFMMNRDLEGGTYIALKGRVPVKVFGNVKKGDRLIAGENGTARVPGVSFEDVFAIALETSTDDGIKIIEAVIL